MKRILVGIDGSEPSLHALKKAAEIGLKFGSKLTLVTIVPPLLLPNDAYAVGVTDVEQEHRRHAEKILKEAAGKADITGLKVDQVMLFGAPAESIAQLAQADDVDLVVVGSRGRNAVMRVLLGSVSDRLVHICPKPILVVR